MRAFGSLLALSLLFAATAADAAPRRVASLNLCTDELLLLLARPEQIASVTHLAHQPQELPYWREARRHDANDGSLLSVARHRPDLVLTMGGGARDSRRIANRLGVRLIELPYPQTLDDIGRSVRVVGHAVGGDARAAQVLQRLRQLKHSASTSRRDTIWLGGGGRTVAAAGLAADWMRLAGLEQRPIQGDRVSLERLLISPPQVLLRSDYRAGQYSGEQRWLDHPLARRASAGKILRTDGRRWTCMGPSLIPEVLRLRTALRG